MKKFHIGKLRVADSPDWYLAWSSHEAVSWEEIIRFGTWRQCIDLMDRLVHQSHTGPWPPNLLVITHPVQ
jgi:hypothetical protein